MSINPISSVTLTEASKPLSYYAGYSNLEIQKQRQHYSDMPAFHLLFNKF